MFNLNNIGSLLFIGDNAVLARSYAYFINKHQLIESNTLISVQIPFIELDSKKPTLIKKLDPYDQYFLYITSATKHEQENIINYFKTSVQIVLLNDFDINYWIDKYNQLHNSKISLASKIQTQIKDLYTLEHVMELIDFLSLEEIQEYLKWQKITIHKQQTYWRKLYLLKTEKIKTLPIFT